MNLISHYFGRDTHIQNHRAMRLSVGTSMTFLMQYKFNKKPQLEVEVKNVGAEGFEPPTPWV